MKERKKAFMERKIEREGKRHNTENGDEMERRKRSRKNDRTEPEEPENEKLCQLMVGEKLEK